MQLHNVVCKELGSLGNTHSKMAVNLRNIARKRPDGKEKDTMCRRATAHDVLAEMAWDAARHCKLAQN